MFFTNSIPRLKLNIKVQVINEIQKASEMIRGFCIIDRADNKINICEIKFYKSKYKLTLSDYRTLLKRQEKFQMETKTNKAVSTIWVSVFGLEENKYSQSIIEKSVKLDEFF